jgi:DNA-binding MarR family transcriptional regulator
MSFLLKNTSQVLLLAEQNLKKYRDIVNYAFHKEGYGITYDQWLVLSAISQKQGLTQIVISDMTAKEPASISRILKLLEKKELVQKLPDKTNKRAKRIYLSPVGDEIQQRATKSYNALAKEGFNGIYEQEINLFVRILEKLKGNFEKMSDKRGE